MQSYIQYGNRRIEYSITRRKRKSVGIAVSLEAGVQIIAPNRVSAAQIQDIVQKKAEWISKKLSLMEEIKNNMPKREFISGEMLPYLGADYTLEVLEQSRLKSVKASLLDDKFVVSIPTSLPDEERPQRIREALVKLYRQCALELAIERIQAYSVKTGLEPSKVIIKEQRKRWGSCTASGIININWKIVIAPISVVDYLVVHELAHLKVRNHSKDFWKFVESILPDYKVHSQWLKANGLKLEL